MKFKIEIECDNAAFHLDEGCLCDDGVTEPCAFAAREQVSLILRNVAEKLDEDYCAGFPFDLNGNKVGEWGFSK